MNIILKEDIAGLGYKNDLVKVKDGYARNYLIPQAGLPAGGPKPSFHHAAVSRSSLQEG